MVGSTDCVLKTIAFVHFDAYDSYRVWRPSRPIMEFMQKLSLKTVSRSDRYFKHFQHIWTLSLEQALSCYCSIGALAVSDVSYWICQIKRIMPIGVNITLLRGCKCQSASIKCSAIHHDWIVLQAIQTIQQAPIMTLRSQGGKNAVAVKSVVISWRAKRRAWASWSMMVMLVLLIIIGVVIWIVLRLFANSRSMSDFPKLICRADILELRGYLLGCLGL